MGWDLTIQKIVEVAERLQDIGIKALSIHGRTRKQNVQRGSRLDADCCRKNNPELYTHFGNGDIDSPQKALEYKNKYGVDGIMIGRAAIGAP